MLLTTENKFYTHNQVWWACVLGGPLIGCYLVSKNYSNFGQVTFARKVLILGIAISIVLIGVLVSLPDHLLHGMPKWLVLYCFLGIVRPTISGDIYQKQQSSRLAEIFSKASTFPFCDLACYKHSIYYACCVISLSV
jgi:hypothetical protein